MVFKFCLCCYVFAIKFYGCIYGENDIHHDVKDPADRNVEANVPWRFDFNVLPAGFLIADGDSLEDTQEAGGHNGHAAENSKNIQKKVIAPIVEDLFQTKSC